MTFHADSPRIDCRVQFQFDGQKIGQGSDKPKDGVSPFVHEKKLRFKLLPALSTGATGVRDLPFAVAETGHRYVEGNYWTALADGERGSAFCNRGTMGAVRDGGLSLPLAYAIASLLNSIAALYPLQLPGLLIQDHQGARPPGRGQQEAIVHQVAAGGFGWAA